MRDPLHKPETQQQLPALRFDRISVTRLQKLSNEGGLRVMTIHAELGDAAVSVQIKLEAGNPFVIVNLDTRGEENLPPIASPERIQRAIAKYIKDQFGSLDSGAIIRRIDSSWPQEGV